MNKIETYAILTVLCMSTSMTMRALGGGAESWLLLALGWYCSFQLGRSAAMWLGRKFRWSGF